MADDGAAVDTGVMADSGPPALARSPLDHRAFPFMPADPERHGAAVEAPADWDVVLPVAAHELDVVVWGRLPDASTSSIRGLRSAIARDVALRRLTTQPPGRFPARRDPSAGRGWAQRRPARSDPQSASGRRPGRADDPAPRRTGARCRPARGRCPTERRAARLRVRRHAHRPSDPGRGCGRWRRRRPVPPGPDRGPWGSHPNRTDPRAGGQARGEPGSAAAPAGDRRRDLVDRRDPAPRPTARRAHGIARPPGRRCPRRVPADRRAAPRRGGRPARDRGTRPQPGRTNRAPGRRDRSRRRRPSGRSAPRRPVDRQPARRRRDPERDRRLGRGAPGRGPGQRPPPGRGDGDPGSSAALARGGLPRPALGLARLPGRGRPLLAGHRHRAQQTAHRAGRPGLVGRRGPRHRFAPAPPRHRRAVAEEQPRPGPWPPWVTDPRRTPAGVPARHDGRWPGPAACDSARDSSDRAAACSTP